MKGLPINRGWFALWVIPLASVVGLARTGNAWFLYGVTLGFLTFGAVCLWSAEMRRRRAAILLWAGLAATMVGDYFLAISNAPTHSKDFLYGMGGFTLTHVLWLVFFISFGKYHFYAGLPLLLGFGVFYGRYLFDSFPVENEWELRIAVALYGVLSCLNLAYALGSKIPGRLWLSAGLGMLAISDTMIALGAFLYVGQVWPYVGPTYVASLILMALGASCFTLRRKEPAAK